MYAREIVQELIRQGQTVTLLLEPGVDSDALGVSCPVVHAPTWTRKAVLSMLWHLLVLPFWLRRNRGSFDGMFICAANRRVCAFYPLPTVATVHDLANFHIKGKYSALRMLYLARILPWFAKRAHHLVAVSGATRKDMVAYWHCAESEVTVLYNGCRVPCHEAPAPRGQAILYISRIEHPGKNHLRLIEAYGRLPHDTAKSHPLVLAGADWKEAQLVHRAAENSPNAEFIRFTGFVEDLGALWREAGFYIFPSLFEGFGLSLVEAMAYGIPCACSDNGSLGEIAGDAAITFPPEETDAIAQALERLLGESPEEREKRIARGFAQARKFSWESHAKGIMALLEAHGN